MRLWGRYEAFNDNPTESEIQMKKFITKSDVVVATTHYNIDEPCIGLVEMDIQTPAGWHRFQILNVIRNDRIAECRIDLGKQTKADQFRIPGGVIDEKGHGEILHTVGELQEIADKLRSRECCDKRELAGTRK